MNYNGFEVFALVLGNADSFFIRHYENGVKTNILIDGGNSSDADVVLGVLATLNETRLDHVVCSHHHADHAGGLVGLLSSTAISIGRLWLHIEEMVSDQEVWNSGFIQNQKAFADKMALSKAYQHELVRLAMRRNPPVPISNPYSVASGSMPRIGPLHILSPTPEFYTKQIETMKSEALQSLLSSRYAARENRKLLEKALKDFQDEAEERQGGLGNEPTAPDNEVSTVLALVHDGASREVFLFTGDAGVEALSDVRERFGAQLEKLAWMQMPHHGSRRNLNQDLVDYFKPKTVVVSAKGSIKHPSRKLVNAFKAGGARVYGTYWKNRKPSEGHWTRWWRGTIPEMQGLVSSTPLWD